MIKGFHGQIIVVIATLGLVSGAAHNLTGNNGCLNFNSKGAETLQEAYLSLLVQSQ